jgi:hypothetical protein
MTDESCSQSLTRSGERRRARELSGPLGALRCPLRVAPRGPWRLRCLATLVGMEAACIGIRVVIWQWLP